MKYEQHDGGRIAAGYKGRVGDCVIRAIAIATGKSYQEVYDAMNALARRERRGRRKKGISNARTGIYKQTYRRFLESLGWEWVPTMQVGQGCKVHLRAEELPKGTLIVQLSRHLVCVRNGVVYDVDDPRRGGNRCVYGYFVVSDSKTGGVMQ